MRFRLYILFLFFMMLCLHGQVTIVPILNKEKISKDENLQLTFVVQIKGKIKSESALYLPDFSKFQIIGSASNRNTVIIGEEAVDEKIYQWVLRPLKAGNVKIGSAKINVNGEDYFTQPIDVEVTNESIAKSDQEKVIQPYMEMELDKQKVYQNEPVSGQIKIYATTIRDLRKVRDVRFQNQEHLKTSQISYRKSDVEVIRPHLVSQTVVHFVVVPDKEGDINVQPAIATLPNGKNIETQPLRLNVSEVPEDAPKGYGNAVGEGFQLSIQKEEEHQVQLNQPFHIRLILKGNGNVSNLIPPKLKAQNGLSIFPPKIKRNVQNTEVIVDYVAVPKKSGDVVLTTDPFVYFKPSEKKYKLVTSPKLRLRVELEEQLKQDESSPFEKVNQYTNNVLSTVDTPILDTKELQIEDEKSFPWKVIVFNSLLLLFFLLLFVFFRKWQKNKIKNENNSQYRSLGSVEESEKEIKKILDNSIEEDLLFIKSLKNKKKYVEFFTAISQLSDEIVLNSQCDDIESLVFNLLGDKGVADYRILAQKIQCQKFNPVKEHAEIESIYEAIVKLYSQISK